MANLNKRWRRTQNILLPIICSILMSLDFGKLAIANSRNTDMLISPYADRLNFYRFQEDYSGITEEGQANDWFASIKNIPLWSDTYVSICGDYRYRFESVKNRYFSLNSVADFELHLNRFLLHTDVHWHKNFRTFVQFSAYSGSGRPNGPAPVDKSETDIQQTFLDIGTKASYLRFGRQELVLGSGLFMGVREGPNQRRSFDACSNDV